MRCHTNAVCHTAGGGQSAAGPVAAQEGIGSPSCVLGWPLELVPETRWIEQRKLDLLERPMCCSGRGRGEDSQLSGEPLLIVVF